MAHILLDVLNNFDKLVCVVRDCGYIADSNRVVWVSQVSQSLNGAQLVILIRQLRHMSALLVLGARDASKNYISLDGV